jgi:hypothetical protein
VVRQRPLNRLDADVAQPVARQDELGRFRPGQPPPGRQAAVAGERRADPELGPQRKAEPRDGRSEQRIAGEQHRSLLPSLI